MTAPRDTFPDELRQPGARITERASEPPTNRPTGSVSTFQLSDTELPKVVNLPTEPGTQRGRRIALRVLLVLSVIAVGWIASPLWVGLAFGTVMAFTAQTLYRKLAARLGDRRTLAAAIVTLLSGLVTAGAAVVVLYLVTRELFTIGAVLRGKMASSSLAGMIGDGGASLVDRMGLDRVEVLTKIHHELDAASTYAASAAGVILQATTSGVIGLLIALLTMFYVLLEWPKIAVRLERVLPLDPRHTRALILEFRDVGRGALIGTLATAMVQGALGGVAYGVLGVPQAVTWGVFTMLASFLPVVGTGMVWGPIGAYLIMTGRPAAGIFLLAWGLCVVMTVTDYVIRPRLVGRKGHGHPLLILIALLGGIEVFGLPGLIVAPIVMSLFLAVLRIYERDIRRADVVRQRMTPT